MSRIASTFQALKRRNRKALIPFITAGDPTPQATPAVMHALVRQGADLIELGIPFSDPMADGPAIQRANERALAHGVSLPAVLDLAAQFRRDDERTPVILMGYLNPVETFGGERFAAAAAAAGVDGVIIVDLPPEEAAPLNQQLCAVGVDQVFLISPTTTSRRADLIARIAAGFLYYVSVKGVTGGKEADPLQVRDQLRQVTQQSSLPLAVGFGVKDAAAAARLAEHCDAVVIGSALVERLHAAAAEKEDVPEQAGAFIAPVRRALDQAAGEAAP